MEREYVRGNKEHWRDVCKYVYGMTVNSACGVCNDDKVIFVKNKVGEYTLYTDEITVDAITTNPNWHEIKPWENKSYEPKPFDKVLGWHDDENTALPDIFLHKHSDVYCCARNYFQHVKPYNEEEYLKSLEKSTEDE